MKLSVDALIFIEAILTYGNVYKKIFYFNILVPLDRYGGLLSVY